MCACRMSRNKLKDIKKMQNRREQGDLMLNATQMDDFTEIGEVLNIPLTKSINFYYLYRHNLHHQKQFFSKRELVNENGKLILI